MADETRVTDEDLARLVGIASYCGTFSAMNKYYLLYALRELQARRAAERPDTQEGE